MTLLCLIIALFATAETGSAQDAMPTKEETINYIDKQLQEVLGLRASPTHNKWERMSFRMSGGNISCEVAESYPSHPERFVFNPRHIKTVVVGKAKDGNSHAYIGIVFLKGTLRSAAGGTELRVDSRDEPFINLPYLVTVPGNGDRIAKALLHLKDLAKAEDELF